MGSSPCLSWPWLPLKQHLPWGRFLEREQQNQPWGRFLEREQQNQPWGRFLEREQQNLPSMGMGRPYRSNSLGTSNTTLYKLLLGINMIKEGPLTPVNTFREQ